MSESAVAKKTPFVTYTVIGLCVLVYLFELRNYPAVVRALVDPIGRRNRYGLDSLHDDSGP
jgi:hypothetical protein